MPQRVRKSLASLQKDFCEQYFLVQTCPELGCLTGSVCSLVRDALTGEGALAANMEECSLRHCADSVIFSPVHRPRLACCASRCKAAVVVKARILPCHAAAHLFVVHVQPVDTDHRDHPPAVIDGAACHLYTFSHHHASQRLLRCHRAALFLERPLRPSVL